MERARGRKKADAAPASGVAETQAAYVADRPAAPVWGRTRLSSKNQVTLPVAMVRELGIRAGDEIDIMRWGDELILSRRPQTPDEWVAKFAGSINVPEWDTREKIDAYVRGERDSWERDQTDS